MENWKIKCSKYLFIDKFLTIRSDSVILDNGSEIENFYVIENPNWVNVIAITEEGKFIIEKQYRHGLKKIGYEICAGMIDEGETPLQAAKRELLEETGYSGGTWVEYCISSPNPSSMNNLNYTYLAMGVKKIAKQNLEETENIEIELMSQEQVIELLETNQIIEGLMQAPLWRYFFESKENNN